MKQLTIVPLLCFALFTECFAGQFSAEGITLDIPKGFEGPVSQSVERGMMYGFSKVSSTPRVRTLLQLSSYDLAKTIPRLSKEEFLVGSDKYLQEFLKGVERRRTGFKQSRIAHISLGGIPASKISWSGSLQGVEMKGVMYCVIVGSKAISLHTQDAGNEITPNMLEAMRSIESLVLTQKN
jgi:hypothetical protein